MDNNCSRKLWKCTVQLCFCHTLYVHPYPRLKLLLSRAKVSIAVSGFSWLLLVTCSKKVNSFCIFCLRWLLGNRNFSGQVSGCRFYCDWKTDHKGVKGWLSLICSENSIGYCFFTLEKTLVIRFTENPWNLEIMTSFCLVTTELMDQGPWVSVTGLLQPAGKGNDPSTVVVRIIGHFWEKEFMFINIRLRWAEWTDFAEHPADTVEVFRTSQPREKCWEWRRGQMGKTTSIRIRRKKIEPFFSRTLSGAWYKCCEGYKSRVLSAPGKEYDRDIFKMMHSNIIGD